MFKNLRVRSRLIIILVVSTVALLGVGLLGLVNGHRTAIEIDHVYLGGADKIQELLTVERLVHNKLLIPIQKLRDGLISSTEASESIRQARDTLSSSWNVYASSDSGLSEQLLTEQHAVISQTLPLIKNLEGVMSRVLEAIQQQDKKQLDALTTKGIYPLTDPISHNIEQLTALHAKDTLEDYQTALSSSFLFQMTTLTGLCIALAILIPLTIVIIRSIVKPIEYASEAVATGDTKMDVKIISGGELGQLLQSVRNMFLSLDKIGTVLKAISTGDLTVETSLRSERDVLGHALHDMVTQMRVMIGDIKTEVNSLTSSSQEIMTSLTHISSGAAETASAVTETTTTIEELKQTANISVEKAKDVLANAEETLQAVKVSEESVSGTIQDMNQIRERMQVISDSILQLSEKSSAIAEIMDTVNDIAEQSNLLAVNAAIEAAKAGEVGRSFGVVAQEIRTLAEQSKGATVQVKALLGDIQTATGSAVLATEQGSKAVSKGVEQSTRTSKTIKELAGKMTRVNQAANQIVLSNQQQLIGTEQITVAMGQISEATTQHVDHLKQIEMAVLSLNQVGGTLKGLTDRYRIAEHSPELSDLTPEARAPQPNKRLAPRLA